MKHLSLILSFLTLTLSASATVYIGSITHEYGYGEEYHDCAYDVPATVPTKTVYLWGKVRVVKDYKDADLSVYVTQDPMQYDMYVQWVESNPDECGLWQRVDSGEEFTIQFVPSPDEADLVIYYDDPRKHYNNNATSYSPFLK